MARSSISTCIRVSIRALTSTIVIAGRAESPIASPWARPTSSARECSVFFVSSRRRHTRFDCDWSSDVCSSDLEDASDTPTPEDRDQRRKYGTNAEQDRAFALAAASLRQALQSLPELAEISKQVMFEQTKDGLNIEIIDQDGRSMFPEGGKEPYERTRRLIQKLAGQLKALP